VVADHTKFGQVASALIAPVERISTLVTDGLTDPATLERFRQLGVRIIVTPAMEAQAERR
jgi:DeoR/GlpR family transcriptional regulator of sugar metabolism